MPHAISSINKANASERPATILKRLALSYPLSVNTPFPDGGQAVRISPVSQLARGDISNTSLVQFWNHCGTHIDGPAHVLPETGPLSQYCPPTGLFLKCPVVLDIACANSRLITAEALEQHDHQLADCDILLLRTGFSRYRPIDPELYVRENPGIETSFARFLTQHCPNLVCIGIDAISFAAAKSVKEGIDAHRILLSQRPPVLLIEDITLDYDLTNLQSVMVTPLFIENLDSCPCTVVAEVLQPAGDKQTRSE